MKKITSLFVVVGICTASPGVFALNSGWSETDLFAGLSGGYAKTKVQVEGISADDKGDSTGFVNLHLGNVWQDEARAYITVGYNKPKDADLAGSARVTDIKQLNVLVSADCLFMPDSEFQPFAGLTIGASDTKATGYQLGTPEYNGSFDRKWSFAYGAQGGVLYKIDNFDLEVGLRYLTNSTSHRYEKHPHVKLKVNDSHQLYVAASMHF